MASAAHADYYARLDVARAATAGEVRRAYLTLAKQLHPDRGGGPQAAAQLARIGEAWAVLREPMLRRVYDERGFAGLEEIDNQGGIVRHETDDEDDDEADSVDASPMASPRGSDSHVPPSVAAFFGAGAAAASASVQPTSTTAQRAEVLQQSHSARWAQGLADREGGKTATKNTTRPAAGTVDRETAVHIADAVAEAIRRTEERAAARYERALVLLMRQMDPKLDAAHADARVRQAWAEAA